MEALTCRLLPWEVADGPTNMAADEILVRRAAEAGVAALRLYGWSRATVSLGYFQPAAVRLSDRRLARLPFVRRPSGGETLVHHHEVTYALAVPPAERWHAGGPWLRRMHGIIAEALSGFGLTEKIVPAGPENAARHGEVLCFLHYTPEDLLCASYKVVGSAQRKYRRALLQHGSILLARSEHTPMLRGLRELAGIALAPVQVYAAVSMALRHATGWRFAAGPWSPAEREEIAALAKEKYATAEWNERR